MHEDIIIDNAIDNIPASQKKFSFHLWAIHLTSRKLWIWIISSYFVFDMMHNGFTEGVEKMLILAWLIVSVIYLIGEPIEKGIGAMFHNAKLSAEFKSGTNLDIKKDFKKNDA